MTTLQLFLYRPWTYYFPYMGKRQSYSKSAHQQCKKGIQLSILKQDTHFYLRRMCCHVTRLIAVWQRLDVRVESFCWKRREPASSPDWIIGWISGAAAAEGIYSPTGSMGPTSRQIRYWSRRGQIKPQNILTPEFTLKTTHSLKSENIAKLKCFHSHWNILWDEDWLTSEKFVFFIQYIHTTNTENKSLMSY